MNERFPWYDAVDTDELEQGDLLLGCSVLEPLWTEDIQESKEKEYTLTALQRIYDVIIMTQSCDLVNEKVDVVLVCPYFPVQTFVEDKWPQQAASIKAAKKLREKIRQGEMPGYHMIAPCEISGHEQDLQIVSFYQVFSVPKLLLTQLAREQRPRLRLMPPYREHLGQAFARFFMRVGLPIDIPRQDV